MRRKSIPGTGPFREALRASVELVRPLGVTALDIARDRLVELRVDAWLATRGDLPYA